MCVAAIAWRMNEQYPLVAIGNRDEFHARAAAPLARWDDAPQVAAGRDLVGGGTWLGVSDAGRFALVTNRRGFGGPDPAKLSRGEMVRSVLADEDGPERLAEADLDSFNPFSLFVVNGGDTLSFHSNRPALTHTELPPGIYGLSNGALDKPWPKTLALKAAVGEWMSHGGDELDPLFAALRSETLPQAGIGPVELSDIAIEPQDTPPFIRNAAYGTRCSTIVTLDAAGKGLIAERSFDAAGNETGRAEVPFAWNTP